MRKKAAALIREFLFLSLDFEEIINYFHRDCKRFKARKSNIMSIIRLFGLFEITLCRAPAPCRLSERKYNDHRGNKKRDKDAGDPLDPAAVGKGKGDHRKHPACERRSAMHTESDGYADVIGPARILLRKPLIIRNQENGIDAARNKACDRQCRKDQSDDPFSHYLKYLSKRPFKALPCLASSLAISSDGRFASSGEGTWPRLRRGWRVSFAGLKFTIQL